MKSAVIPGTYNSYYYQVPGTVISSFTFINGNVSQFDRYAFLFIKFLHTNNISQTNII